MNNRPTTNMAKLCSLPAYTKERLMSTHLEIMLNELIFRNNTLTPLSLPMYSITFSLPRLTMNILSLV